MKGYSETDIFSVAELQLLKEATWMVERFDAASGVRWQGRPEIRCHELARAVGAVLDLPVQDGWTGMVDHSWLWTEKPQEPMHPWAFPNLLDVYAVGRLPQVQLVTMKNVGPGYVQLYRACPLPRTDIDEALVHELTSELRRWL